MTECAYLGSATPLRSCEGRGGVTHIAVRRVTHIAVRRVTHIAGQCVTHIAGQCVTHIAVGCAPLCARHARWWNATGLQFPARPLPITSAWAPRVGPAVDVAP